MSCDEVGLRCWTCEIREMHLKAQMMLNYMNKHWVFGSSLRIRASVVWFVWWWVFPLEIMALICWRFFLKKKSTENVTKSLPEDFSLRNGKWNQSWRLERASFPLWQHHIRFYNQICVVICVTQYTVFQDVGERWKNEWNGNVKLLEVYSKIRFSLSFSYSIVFSALEGAPKTSPPS